MFSPLLIVLFLVYSRADDNVCPTYEDYIVDIKDECWYNPDVNDVIENIGPRYGRKVVNLQTTTEDGYKLTISKLTNAQQSENNGRYPILFIHGMTKGRENWVLNATDSFAIRYSKDNPVYVLGTRGTRGSLGHVSLSTSDPEYWDFSYDEMRFDVESTIQTILADSGMDKLILICHSQGCADYGAFATLMSDYANAHILHAILLSPGILVGPVKQLTMAFLSEFTTAIGYVGPLVTNGHISSHFLDNCQNVQFMKICETFIRDICGTSNYINYPATLKMVTSPVNNNDLVVRVINHFLQNINHQSFDRPDFGKEKNLIKYNQEEPPKYPLENIKHNVTFITFSDDPVCTPENSQKVYDLLQTDKEIYHLPQDLNCDKEMSHLDALTNCQMVPCLQKLTDKIIDNLYIS